MTLTCLGYSAKPLPNGEIQLTIEEARQDVSIDRLNLDEVAALVGKTKRAVDKLSRRQKDPLPLHRGKGRTFGLASEIRGWQMGLALSKLQPGGGEKAANDIRSVFC